MMSMTSKTRKRSRHQQFGQSSDTRTGISSDGAPNAPPRQREKTLNSDSDSRTSSSEPAVKPSLQDPAENSSVSKESKVSGDERKGEREKKRTSRRPASATDTRSRGTNDSGGKPKGEHKTGSQHENVGESSKQRKDLSSGGHLGKLPRQALEDPKPDADSRTSPSDLASTPSSKDTSASSSGGKGSKASVCKPKGENGESPPNKGPAASGEGRSTPANSYVQQKPDWRLCNWICPICQCGFPEKPVLIEHLSSKEHKAQVAALPPLPT